MHIFSVHFNTSHKLFTGLYITYPVKHFLGHRALYIKVHLLGHREPIGVYEYLLEHRVLFKGARIGGTQYLLGYRTLIGALLRTWGTNLLEHVILIGT